MVVELVTDPDVPIVPWVLTVIAPVLKNSAGPTNPLVVVAVAVIVGEPPAGSVTRGLAAAAAWVEGTQPAGRLFVGGFVQTT